MAKNKIENLSDEDLEQKYQNLTKVSKGVSIVFVVMLLIAIGYTGYANGKGDEASPIIIPILLLLFIGQKVIFSTQLSPIIKEIKQREK